MRQCKPNLGHSEGAAALTSVMKATLSLENRTILPNIKFNDPNPRSAWSPRQRVGKHLMAMLTVLSCVGCAQADRATRTYSLAGQQSRAH